MRPGKVRELINGVKSNRGCWRAFTEEVSRVIGEASRKEIGHLNRRIDGLRGALEAMTIGRIIHKNGMCLEQPDAPSGASMTALAEEALATDEAMDYWGECIAEAFEDANITATEEQISIVSSWVEGAHDNYSQAHGHDCIPNPLRAEVDKLKSELHEERRKIQCRECRGTGRIVSQGPYHSSESSCHICRGEGRHLP
jgi:hypothetical protein